MRVIVGGSRVGKGADELGFVSEAKAGASLEDESVDEKAKGHVVVDRVSTMDLLGFDAGSMPVERELLVVSAHFPVVGDYAMVEVKQFK